MPDNKLLSNLYGRFNKVNQNLIFYFADKIDFRRPSLISNTLIKAENELLKYSQYFNPSEIEEIQTWKVKRILRSAASIPYWKEKFKDIAALAKKVKSVKEIKELPFLTREDIQCNPRQYMTNPFIPEKRGFFWRTSGSTGEPLVFILDNSVIPGRLARYQRMIDWFNFNFPVSIVKVMPTQPPFGLDRIQHFFLKRKNDLREALKDLYFLLKLDKQNRKFVIDVFSSHVKGLHDVIKELNLEPPSIAAFVCGGEMFPHFEREPVKKELSCDIRGYYASSEFEIIAQECGRSPGNSFHINSEYFYIEIVDERGFVVPEGKKGRVIITSLEHELMPFLRYEIGDLGYLVPGKCPCGRTLPLLELEGRKAHLISLPNGKTLSVFQIFIIITLKGYEYIKQYQIIHDKPAYFIIKIVPRYGTVPAHILSKIHSELLLILGDGIKVTLETIESIPLTPGLKTQQFIKNF